MNRNFLISNKDSLRFVKPSRVIGQTLVFRDATTADAEFILMIRSEKGKHLSVISGDVQDQIAWLERYALDNTQLYFIIENNGGDRLGTVRLYDQRGDSFCWGSWILRGAHPTASYESALMVYQFALELGFKKAHFDVRQGNDSVWSFHERFGATRVSQTGDDMQYVIGQKEILSALTKYRRFLPEGIRTLP